MRHTAVLIPGDGIGPEVTSAARRIMEAAGASIDWIERPAGQAALDAGQTTALPEETLQAIRTHGVALKGPCTTPIGGSAGITSRSGSAKPRMRLASPTESLPFLMGDRSPALGRDDGHPDHHDVLVHASDVVIISLTPIPPAR